MDLNIRDKKECRYDAVSLGEVMLRFDPGEGRIRTAREVKVWEGGGEYNVIRGLRRCFGMNTAVITSFADNEVGHLVEDFILQGGVDTSLINWKKTDGIGRECRNGLNFVERGFGIRGALSVSDRTQLFLRLQIRTLILIIFLVSLVLDGSTQVVSMQLFQSSQQRLL